MVDAKDGDLVGLYGEDNAVGEVEELAEIFGKVGALWDDRTALRHLFQRKDRFQEPVPPTFGCQRLLAVGTNEEDVLLGFGEGDRSDDDFKCQVWRLVVVALCGRAWLCLLSIAGGLLEWRPLSLVLQCD